MKRWGFISFILFFLVAGDAGNTKAATPGEQVDHPEVPRISAFEAKKLFDQGKLILANAHAREKYNQKHILGSILLSVDEVKNMNFELPKDKIIAFYCA